MSGDFQYGELIIKSNEHMCELEANSAQLVIGSPPFSRSIGYSSKSSKNDFLELMEKVIQNSHRILNKTGVFINVSTDERHNGQLWQKSNDISTIAQKYGFSLCDHIIWSRTRISIFRVPFSHILIFKKGKTVPSIESEELRKIFLEKIWYLPDSQIRKNHSGPKFTSAMHPRVAELLISRYSKSQDLVINPFVGSGTIIAIAEMLKRRWIGYEIDKKLLPLIYDTFSQIKESNLVFN